MPLADIGGRSLSYLRQGSGSPLLLIMGMAGHSRMWGDPLVDGLAADYDVVAFDHRGVGDSTDVEGEFSVADLATDAAALLDSLGWVDAHVLGFSLGGMVAQELAISFPERVRTLVLASTYPGGEVTDFSSPGALEMYQAMGTGDLDTAIRAGFAANLSPAYIAEEANYAPFKAATQSVPLGAPVVMRQAQAAVAHDASGRLGQLHVPTLILHGTEDRVVKYSNGLALQQLIPGARLHTIDGAPHLFWWEHIDETLAQIRGHCRP